MLSMVLPMVCRARHGDDAGARALQDVGQQGSGECPMSQVVDPELHLEPVCGLTLRDRAISPALLSRMSMVGWAAAMDDAASATESE